MILRTKKLQDYLNNIFDIKCLLVNLQTENRISEKSEKLKFELLDKLPKAFETFYMEFYKMKKRSNWVKIIRIKDFWNENYFIKLKNNKILNINEKLIKFINESDLKKNSIAPEKKIYRETIDISDTDDFDEKPNIKNKEVYFRNSNKNNNYNNVIIKNDSKKDINEDKSPFMSREQFYSNNISERTNFNNNENNNDVIKNRKLSNQNFSNNFNESSNNNIKEVSNHQNIISNKLTKNNFSSENFFLSNNDLNDNNKKNFFYNTHQESFLNKNFNNPHDDKPIKANPNIFNEFLKEKENDQNQVTEILNTDENSIQQKTCFDNNINFIGNKKNSSKDNRLRRKTPKYDARKAIENAKSKDKNIFTNNLIKEDNLQKEILTDNHNKNEKFSNPINNYNNKNNNKIPCKKEKELLEKINSLEFIDNVPEEKLPAYGPISRNNKVIKLKTNVVKIQDNDLSDFKEEDLHINNEKQLRIEKLDEEEYYLQDKNSTKAKSHKIIHSNREGKNKADNNKINCLKININEDQKDINIQKTIIKSMKSPNNVKRKDIDNLNSLSRNDSNFNYKDGGKRFLEFKIFQNSLINCFFV